MANEWKVPISQSDNSLIEQEFDSIRDKFEFEMRKMEEEMSRFRQQLMEAERSREQISSESSSQQSVSSKSRQVSKSSCITASSKSSVNRVSSSRLVDDGPVSSWLGDLNSPLIKEDSEGVKVLKLRFDVSPYEPEQILVKTLDNRLQIHAKREEKTSNSSMYREYNREFLLPDGTDPQLIRSSLSADGVLTVEAPLPLESLK